jgi:ankyrin repeat protein
MMILPSLKYVRTLMNKALFFLHLMPVLIIFNLLFSLFPEFTPEPISTLGNTEPWALPAPPSYPPQNARTDQQNLYASSADHSFFGNPVLQSSQMDDINRQDHDGRTRLHHSIIKGSTQEVEDLLSLGASIDIQDSHGDQPLHYAASKALEGIL